ncbi:MAG: S8 family serine peptidase [Betaproteobacteria bacterium]|nr:S8 family serine peptidase [Betaproteobacteria bacterium]
MLKPLSVAPVTSASPAAPPRKVAPPPEPGQIVIFWKDAGQAAFARAVLLQEFNLRPYSESQLPHLGGVLGVFKLASHAEAESLRGRLSQRFPEWRIDFNARYMPHSDDPPAARAASPRLYHAAQVSAIPLDASGVRVGILDSAVERIPALAGASITQRGFVPAAERPAPAAHGTAVAALIAGAETQGFKGLATGARLFVAGVLRMQEDQETTTTATVVRALDWLLSERVSVINLSLGGTGDRILAQAIAKVLSEGVVVVAAAGNAGPDAPPSYPAAYPGVIAVTANDALERPYAAANRGHYVSLSAPGVDVWIPDTDRGRYVSGTSYAAALVSAASAQLIGKGARADAVGAALCTSARDIGEPGRDPVFGCGLLQLQPALVALAPGRR